MTRNSRATIEVLFGACSKSAFRGRIKIKSHPSFAGKVIGTLSITPPSSNSPPLSRTYGKNGGKSIDADGLPPKPMDTCVPLATKNQVRQPKKRVPRAYRGAGNDLDLSKSIMVGQELVDSFHRTRLECALCPSSR